jgi:hypothetical protein
VLPLARALIDLDQLEAACGILPEPQYDALLGLAVGMSPEQVWAEVAGAGVAVVDYDPDDVAAAVERSTERVVLVSGPDELMDVFSYPFALWRVYLHPAQRRMAYGSFGGPARVTGGPGTGKTVAALHRAAHLARSSAADRSVLVTTFTKTLAGSLDDGLRLLVDDEDLLHRLDVRHVDQVAYQVTSAVHGRLPVVTPADEKARWKRLIGRFGLDCNEAFLGQEWRHVVLTQARSPTWTAILLFRDRAAGGGSARAGGSRSGMRSSPSATVSEQTASGPTRRSASRPRGSWRSGRTSPTGTSWWMRRRTWPHGSDGCCARPSHPVPTTCS